MDARLLVGVVLVIIAIASATLPSAVAIRAGEIVLNPSHAPSGALVTFEGLGWDVTIYTDEGGVATSRIVAGEPVKVDRYAVCEIKNRHGVYEPVGNFKVANVPAGTYLVRVTVNPDGVSAEQEFTVDTATTLAIATSTTVQDSSTTTQTSPTATATITVVPVTKTILTTEVVTIRKEEPQNQSLLLIAIVAVVGLVAVALTTIVMRRTR